MDGGSGAAAGLLCPHKVGPGVMTLFISCRLPPAPELGALSELSMSTIAELYPQAPSFFLIEIRSNLADWDNNEG